MTIVCVQTPNELEKHYDQNLRMTPFCVVITQTTKLIIPTGIVINNSVKTRKKFLWIMLERYEIFITAQY